MHYIIVMILGLRTTRAFYRKKNIIQKQKFSLQIIYIVYLPLFIYTIYVYFILVPVESSFPVFQMCLIINIRDYQNLYTHNRVGTKKRILFLLPHNIYDLQIENILCK